MKTNEILEGSGQQYAVYYDYTGAGRRPEPVAGPFGSRQEAEDYQNEEELEGDDYFVEVYPLPN